MSVHRSVFKNTSKDNFVPSCFHSIRESHPSAFGFVVHNVRRFFHQSEILPSTWGVSIMSPRWSLRQQSNTVLGHRPARSQPQTASHSAFKSWHSSLRVATVANKQTNFNSLTMEWFLTPLVLFLLSTFGNILLLYVSSMTPLAPGHAPGPMRRYWAAQQGPK